jgi:hypothetical protein
MFETIARSNRFRRLFIFRNTYGAWVGGAIFVMALSIGIWRQIVTDAKERAREDNPISQRGIGLHRDIDAFYADLSVRHALKRDNDATAIVEKYIPIGTTFEEAERVLRAAGCQVSIEPYIGLAPIEEQKRLSHVDANLEVSGLTFFVELYPPKPNEYSAVANLRASLLAGPFS